MFKKEVIRLSQYDEQELAKMANKLRCRTIEMICAAQTGHPGGSFSIAEMIATLYFKVLRIDPARPDWEDRDRFMLSKGHAAPILTRVRGRGFVYVHDRFVVY